MPINFTFITVVDDDPQVGFDSNDYLDIQVSLDDGQPEVHPIHVEYTRPLHLDSTLSVAANDGDTTISLSSSVEDIDEDRIILIDGDEYTVESVDEDNDELTLTAGLSGDYQAGDLVITNDYTVEDEIKLDLADRNYTWTE